MNIKILLVDDEGVDLRWLKQRVLCMDLPLYVSAAVKTAFAALEVLEREQIDIILTDIRMPIMSGMDFAKRAKEINPNVKIVFISGHQDFGFAKEAIHLSASGYLLKPVDDVELRDLLGKVCLELEGAREQERRVSEALSFAHQELLLRWLEEIAPGPFDEHIRSYFTPLLQDGLAVALVEIDDLEWKFRVETDRRPIAEQIFHFIEEFAICRNMGSVVKGRQDRLLILACAQEAQFVGLLQDMIHEINLNFPVTITVGMGGYAHQPEKLHDSYRGAQAALSTKWLLGKNRLFREPAYPMPKGTSLPDSELNKVAEAMMNAILVYDLVAIDDCLQSLFKRGLSLTQRNDVYNLIIRITSKLHADLLNRNEDLYELLKWETHQPSVLFDFETLEDVLSWLRRRFFELSELLYQKGRNQQRKLIEEIFSYVENSEEFMLTLKDVAARFEYTPNYLGYVFKEETGVFFSDYIQERRMKRVLELLNNPKLKIYEVANQTGYKSMIYFNRQFKLSTGINPREYRKKHKI